MTPRDISGLAAPKADENARIWAASMISPLADQGQGTRASFVSKTFDFDGGISVVPAILHISAMGLYRAFVNGVRVGNDQLTPGWTCYDDRIAFQSYDISNLLTSGQNRIEIWLGDGWYRSQIMWSDAAILNCWGDRIAAIAEVEIAGALLIKTDDSWKSGSLPITRTGIYYGEDFNAQLSGTKDTHDVEALAFDTQTLIPHEIDAVQELPPLAPIETWQADGTIHDFGQNIAGYVRFTVRGNAGSRIRIEHAEVLGRERAFDNTNYRGARAETHYILNGDGDETYSPFFTFMGFRYARVTIEGDAKITEIKAIPITSVPEIQGGFECGVDAVNRLVLNTIWSQRDNFIEVPTDCPQRDERLGWTGDAQVFTGTACWLADSERFLRKYLRDVMHDQRENGAIPHFSPDPTRLHPVEEQGDWAGSTGWGDVITVTPWQLYLHYGDDTVLRSCFPAMRRWVDYLWSLGDGPIVLTHSLWGQQGFTFGDWLQPVGDNRLPRPTIAADCAATIYHYISTNIAADTADIIGEDSSELHERASQIKAAFAHEYIAPSGRLAHNDMTSYALAFLYDLIPDEHVAAAKSYFRKVILDADYLIGTGFIGTPALLPALSKIGMDDIAEGVFLNRKVPGWLYQVDMGATTIWERWDALGPNGEIYDPEMNSYNHYAYGAVCQWLFESVAGITPRVDGAGFTKVTLAPHILPQLSPVSAWHQARTGTIEAGWTLNGSTVTYNVTLPQGCEGVLTPLPGQTGHCVNGIVTDIPEEGVILPAGQHTVTFNLT